MEWKGSMTAVRRSEGPRPGGTDGERASGKTTKILSRCSGGYRDKYGCTRKWGGGREGGPKPSMGQPYIGATSGNEARDSRQCGGRGLLKPLHQHPSQVLPVAQVKGRARARPSGHWDGQQEQHGTSRQSVSGGRRVTTGATGEATNNSKTDGEEARGGERGMHARAKWL